LINPDTCRAEGDWLSVARGWGGKTGHHSTV
jgi:hypothetical protein